MTDNFLQSLGIDPTLPESRILELLQDKNLEYLERLDACSDNARAQELQAKQQEIEQAILDYSTGVKLNRRIKERGQERQSVVQADAAPDRLNAALLDYQRGNYRAAQPVLCEFAEQGDPLACILASNLLVQAGQRREANRYLFIAAEQGDGTATLMLAQSFFQAENFIMAKDWGKKALQLQVQGSGKLLAQVAVREERPTEGIGPMLEDINRATGYERYMLLREVCNLAGPIPSAESLAQIKKLMPQIKDDPRCLALLQGFGQTAPRRKGKRWIALVVSLIAVGIGLIGVSPRYAMDGIKQVEKMPSLALWLIPLFSSTVTFVLSLLHNRGVEKNTHEKLDDLWWTLKIGIYAVGICIPLSWVIGVFLGKTAVVKIVITLLTFGLSLMAVKFSSLE